MRSWTWWLVSFAGYRGDVATGLCYQAHTRKLDFLAARQFCLSDGAALATLDTDSKLRLFDTDPAPKAPGRLVMGFICLVLKFVKMKMSGKISLVGLLRVGLLRGVYNGVSFTNC